MDRSTRVAVGVLCSAILAGGVVAAQKKGTGAGAVASAVQVQQSQGAPTTNPNDPVVARVGDKPIYMSQIQGPLLEAYGLNVLFNLAQLELARQNAERLKLTISPGDIEFERDALAKQMAPDADKKDYPALMKQFLDQQRLSQAELDMLVERRAYLRKIAREDPVFKQGITEDALRAAFGAMYGETVRCRHVQCKNLNDLNEARRRLEAGQSFEQVARDLSENKETAALGGQLLPFSRATPDLPQAFKDVVFALKVGEVSDPVSAYGSFHIVKLEERVPPKAVKFEDVKDAVKAELEEKMMQQAQKEFTSQLTQQAVYMMKIEDPVLKRQFEEKLKAAQGPKPTLDREQIRADLEKSRPPAPGATTTPTTTP